LERSRRSSPVFILSGRELINLALLLSFPAVALEEFLRSPVAQFAAQPVLQLEHWVTESLMTVPLFVIGVWAGDRIAGRAGLGVADRPAAFKRALLIMLFAAVALMPVWFERNKTDGLVQTQALVTPHSHGSVDVYWVGSAVILALACVCLVPAAAWAGDAIASRLKRRPAARPEAPGTSPRAPGLGGALILVAGAAAGAALAWLLHDAAEPAYASQVNYTGALLAVPVHSHAFFGGHAPHTVSGLPVTAAPFAFAHQIAHAFQDGLVGQAAGLPVAVAALLWKGAAAH
jgi:CDP-diglyceride synthetase